MIIQYIYMKIQFTIQSEASDFSYKIFPTTCLIYSKMHFLIYFVLKSQKSICEVIVVSRRETNGLH